MKRLLLASLALSACSAWALIDSFKYETKEVSNSAEFIQALQDASATNALYTYGRYICTFELHPGTYDVSSLAMHSSFHISLAPFYKGKMIGLGEKPEDVRERLLYNAVLGALGKDRRTFLYCNPPNGSELFYPWNGCPCCVGNIPRTLLALKDTLYTFARDGRTLWVDQFMASESDVSLGGRRFHAVMKTAYPDSGTVTLTLSPKPDFEVVVRFPDRTESPLYTAVPAVEHGYRTMKPVSVTEGSATYSWTLPMPYQEVTADERVEACRGRKAYQRGPTVYSWEGPFGDICVPNRSRLRDGGFSAVWTSRD